MYAPFENFCLRKKPKLVRASPLENGDPYFFGQTFMYEIFIQERNSHVVRFRDIRNVWNANSELAIRKKPDIVTVTKSRRPHCHFYFELEATGSRSRNISIA